jgi:hypothetical protein
MLLTWLVGWLVITLYSTICAETKTDVPMEMQYFVIICVFV